MLQNRLLGWHPGLFQQPALFVLTSIWLGHGSPWRFSCHWQTGRRANGSLGAGKVHNLSKVLNFPSWRKHVKCRLYRFVEFQSDKDVTAVLEKPAQSGKVASNSLEWCNGSLYPCCPSCPPCDGITFPKHDGCVDEKCMLTTFVLEDSNATLLHQSWPLLVQETEPWKQRITCDELSNIQKANNFEKVSRFIHEVSSEMQWYFSVKFQDVLRRKALEPGLVCKQP